LIAGTSDASAYPVAVPGALNEQVLIDHPEDANIIKALAERRMPIAGFGGLDAATRKRVFPLVTAYDGSFNAQNYPTELKVMGEFASGKTGTPGYAIQSLNKAIPHIGKLDETFNKLNNGRFPAVNAANNLALSQGIGTNAKATQGALAAFETEANAVAGELATVFKGTSGTDQEIKSWRASLSPHMTPSAFEDSKQALFGLLAGRMNSINQTWNIGMGGAPKNFAFLSGTSRNVLTKSGFAGDLNAIDPVDPNGRGFGRPTQAPAPAKQASPKALPQGFVKD
jgi:hypothetical protein